MGHRTFVGASLAAVACRLTHCGSGAAKRAQSAGAAGPGVPRQPAPPMPFPVLAVMAGPRAGHLPPVGAPIAPRPPHRSNSARLTLYRVLANRRRSRGENPRTTLPRRATQVRPTCPPNPARLTLYRVLADHRRSGREPVNDAAAASDPGPSTTPTQSARFTLSGILAGLRSSGATPSANRRRKATPGQHPSSAGPLTHNSYTTNCDTTSSPPFGHARRQAPAGTREVFSAFFTFAARQHPALGQRRRGERES